MTLTAVGRKGRRDTVVSKILFDETSGLNILGINADGKKELLGMYVCESEGANLWLVVMTDLRNRGVKDKLIVCIDNLKGFEQVILSIYPDAEVQSCVVLQILNSLKYVAS